MKYSQTLILNKVIKVVVIKSLVKTKIITIINNKNLTHFKNNNNNNHHLIGKIRGNFLVESIYLFGRFIIYNLIEVYINIQI